ncbi:hypothetical protein [Streptomyces sp. YIM 132580]|uniref:hypothetical protein n=1 Tax=Streptomyces sp. YIM 132580 TaxID=2691958 RepID=UPI0013714E71|nr:hypothetical protein [Streptomyces sp. YIM 132580]MXG26519.1 hypothetical protein [Streptomyces sp. YIM 132580]
MAGGPERPGRLERLLNWIAQNFELLLAVLGAVTVGVMDLFGDALGDDATAAATVLVLGAIAAGSLRQRARADHLAHAVEGIQRAFEGMEMVRTLTGSEIGAELRTARERGGSWEFKGGTGTYLRAVTLPECVDRARRNRSNFTFSIEVVDPADARACAAYASFRRLYARQQNSSAPETWTPERTSNESYATVLAAGWHLQRFPGMTVHLYLSSTAPTLRFDVSPSRLIITQDDPAQPGLLVTENHPLYRYYGVELRQSRSQARDIELSQARALDNDPTADQARAFFESVGLALPTSYSDGAVREIVDKALRAENPYPI